jgi:polyisoprenoid-binding protein YceI
MRSIPLLAIACLAVTAVVAPAAEDNLSPAESEKRVNIWSADPAHSSILFETGHWGVVDLVGWFEEYEITVHSSELDFSDAAIEARIDPASVRMPNPEMAANLRNLFFLVEEFPEVLFRSTKVEKTEDKDVFTLIGMLTMKSVVKEMVLTVRFNGYGSPPMGAPGFMLHGELDRLDFGVGDMEFMQGTGHPMVDAEVQITCNIRLDYIRTESVRVNGEN